MKARDILKAYKPIAEKRDESRQSVVRCKKMGLYSAKLWRRCELECGEAKEAEESAERVISKVTGARNRQFLRMYYLEGMSPEEIQQIMGLNKRQYDYIAEKAHKEVDAQDGK